MTQCGQSGASVIAMFPLCSLCDGALLLHRRYFSEDRLVPTHLVTTKLIVSYFFPYLIAPNGYQEIVPLPESHQEANGESLWGRDVI